MRKEILTLITIASLLFGSTILFSSKDGSNFRNKELVSKEQAQWNSFKFDYNKKFSTSEEEAYRAQIFRENLNKINSDETGTLGITQFADLSQEEFAQNYLTLKVQKTDSPKSVSCAEDSKTSINWVELGKVSAIKDQGQCGSCWAFSTTGSIESAFLIAGAPDGTEFSEQQLVDCSKENDGCSGGLMNLAYDYIIKNGITSESNYPYTASDGKCVSPTEDLQYIRSYTLIPQTCVSDLRNALAQQPIAIAVDATNWSLYKKGILSQCGNQLNHGVLLVGYENDTWLVKNSWGTMWGQSGYIQLARGNTCGLADGASYPTIKNNEEMHSDFKLV